MVQICGDQQMFQIFEMVIVRTKATATNAASKASNATSIASNATSIAPYGGGGDGYNLFALG